MAFGLYLLVDGIIPLVQAKHATIGSIHLFGRTFWLGWLMLAALVWAAVPPVFLGLAKLPLAKKTHDKLLYADARMNRAGWMSSGAAALGVLGVGFGYWWADYVAAMVISLDVITDGVRHLKRSVCDVMNEVPRTVDRAKVEPILKRIREHLEQTDWIGNAEVRLRAEGHVFFGEAYIVPGDSLPDVETLHRLTDETLKVELGEAIWTVCKRSKFRVEI